MVEAWRGIRTRAAELGRQLIAVAQPIIINAGELALLPQHLRGHGLRLHPRANLARLLYWLGLD